MAGAAADLIFTETGPHLEAGCRRFVEAMEFFQP